MKAFQRELFKKGIKYYHEHGLAALCIKIINFFGEECLHFYYRTSTQIRLTLDHWGMLKRTRPYKGIPKVIISLTSYPARIDTVHEAIETLLVQTYKADRIILWLAWDEFPEGEKSLPPQLRKLCVRGLEIRWCENIRSYKKLIPALEIFPNDIIITFDDDVLIPKHCVQRLIKGYLDRPDCIQCHQAAMMVYIAADHIDRIRKDTNGYPYPSYLNELVGQCGCLYPPHCFHKDITNQKLFMTLAPTNDDLWFWLMAALKGYRVNIVDHNMSKPIHIFNTQEVGLWRINNEGEKLLFVQLRNILQYYPNLNELLMNEQMRIEKLA